jgi:hypothetical protein
MTKYLTGKPFSVACSRGNLTDTEYFVRVGALVYCPTCKTEKAPQHEHSTNTDRKGN